MEMKLVTRCRKLSDVAIVTDTTSNKNKLDVCNKTNAIYANASFRNGSFELGFLAYLPETVTLDTKSNPVTLKVK